MDGQCVKINQMVAILEFVRSHFRRYRTRTKWSFIWRITVESLLMPAAMLLPFVTFFQSPEDGPHYRGLAGFILVVVLAPLYETLLFQAFPVMLFRMLGFNYYGQLLGAWVPFAAIHFLKDVFSGICAGVVGGFYIAFTYVRWREISLGSAFWMTCAVHSLGNLVCFIVCFTADYCGL